jgi:hypothetical protein
MRRSPRTRRREIPRLQGQECQCRLSPRCGWAAARVVRGTCPATGSAGPRGAALARRATPRTPHEPQRRLVSDRQAAHHQARDEVRQFELRDAGRVQPAFTNVLHQAEQQPRRDIASTSVSRGTERCCAGSSRVHYPPAPCRSHRLAPCSRNSSRGYREGIAGRTSRRWTLSESTLALGRRACEAPQPLELAPLTGVHECSSSQMSAKLRAGWGIPRWQKYPMGSLSFGSTRAWVWPSLARNA